MISPLISPLAVLSFLFNFCAFLLVFCLCHLLLTLSMSLLSLPSYNPSSFCLHIFSLSIFLSITVVLHCPSAFSMVFLFFPCFLSCSLSQVIFFFFLYKAKLQKESRVGWISASFTVIPFQWQILPTRLNSDPHICTQIAC